MDPAFEPYFNNRLAQLRGPESLDISPFDPALPAELLARNTVIGTAALVTGLRC